MAKRSPVVDLSALPAALTVEEAADILRVSRGSAYEAVRRGCTSLVWASVRE